MGSQEERPDSGGQESPVLYRHHRMADNPEIWKALAMADHFEKIQKLAEPIPGCPNFRRVPGYKVYCCGQPTVEGFEKALEKVCGSIYPKDGKIIWFNLRQEPSVYINGEPLCARPPNKIGEYAELGNVERDKLKEDEMEFVRVCQGKMKDNGDKLKYVDVNKQEANLGKIIHDIYQTAHTMFSDMPQGDHKKRAKYRFASKTLMRILPSSLKSEVEGLIEKKAITLDLYEILGQCTWNPET